MQLLGILCFVIATIIGLIFGIQILITAFRTSVWWGLGYIFVPFVSLIFIVMHWQETKTPFLRGLIAIPFYVLGLLLSNRG